MTPIADAASPAAPSAGHGWRRLVLAVLTLALSMAIATVLIPPDPDVAAVVVGDTPDR